MKRMLLIFVPLLIIVNFITPLKSAAAAELSKANTIYVPVYKSFYQSYGSTRDAYGLTSTACLHNTDPKNAITVYTIEYYSSNGKLINKLIDEPITIKPWTSREITLQSSKDPEDFGANLIVRWKSDQPVNPLIVEVLMVGQVLNRGVSFLTRGYEIKE
jgi:hypothetical protein